MPTFLSNIVEKTVIYEHCKPTSNFMAHLELYFYGKHELKYNILPYGDFTLYFAFALLERLFH